MSTQRRLDQALTELYPNLSKRQAQKLCKSSRVKVNGKLGRPGQLVTESDRLEVTGEVVAVAARPELVGPDSGFKVLHEDDWLIVAHKPSGMHSVRLTSEDPLTVADCLAAHCSATVAASPDARESGLVNRLDYYTSGLIVAAKSREAWTELRSESAWIEKRYYALVEGELLQDSVVRSLFRNLQGGERVEVLIPIQQQPGESDEQNEMSESRIHPCRGFKDITLVETILRTGKRHQIRAHLAWLRHPIAGDTLYGSTTSLESALERVLGASEPKAINGEQGNEQGFALYAHQLSFFHPHSKAQLQITDTDPVISRLRALAEQPGR